jgi:hypothetical protein
MGVNLRVPFGGSLAGLVALVAVGLLMLTGGLGGANSVLPNPGTVVAMPGTLAAVAPSCNPTNPSPSALYVSASNPTGPLSAGSTLSVAYEVAIVNYTSSQGTIAVYVPSALATFPLTPTPTNSNRSLQLFLPPHVVNVSSAGWSNPNATGTWGSKVLINSVLFNVTQSARLSTQKIAVMAGTGYTGQLTLEFRWQWATSNATGAWTQPNATSKSPNLPSIFYPAPYLPILGLSAFPAPVGSNFTVMLGGAVTGTSFRMVLEYPNNGTEIRSQVENSSATATKFPATVWLVGKTNGTLLPGNYLIHVHDVCNAITHSLSIIATNASVLCNWHTVAPSSFSIPAKNPNRSVKSGSTIQVAYQVKVVNYTSSMGHVTVYIPPVTAVFPLTKSGQLNISAPARNVSIGGGGWTGGGATTFNYKTAVAIQFNSSAVAHLTTQKIAVMASTSYNGKVQVEFEWRWVIPGLNGVWTVPSYSYTNPYLPSIFYPAPLVPVLSNTSASQAGTNYTVVLGGAVSHTTFRMVLEYPNNGTEIRSQDEYTALGVKTFNATVFLATKGTTSLPAGHYLVHVHDACDAILHSLTVTIPSNGSNSPSGGTGLVGGLGAPSTSPAAAAPTSLFGRPGRASSG